MVANTHRSEGGPGIGFGVGCAGAHVSIPAKSFGREPNGLLIPPRTAPPPGLGEEAQARSLLLRLRWGWGHVGPDDDDGQVRGRLFLGDWFCSLVCHVPVAPGAGVVVGRFHVGI